MRSAVTAVLNRGDVTAVDLDLAGLTLLDPAAAGALVVVHRIAVNLRVALRLRAISVAAAEAMKLLGAADLLPGPSPATGVHRMVRVLVRSSRRPGEAPPGHHHRRRERHRAARCGVLRPRGCRCRAGRPQRRTDRRRAPALLSGGI
nr:hypothetical protein [Actinoplanes maris]